MTMLGATKPRSGPQEAPQCPHKAPKTRILGLLGLPGGFSRKSRIFNTGGYVFHTFLVILGRPGAAEKRRREANPDCKKSRNPAPWASYGKPTFYSFWLILWCNLGLNAVFQRFFSKICTDLEKRIYLKTISVYRFFKLGPVVFGAREPLRKKPQMIGNIKKISKKWKTAIFRFF